MFGLRVTVFILSLLTATRTIDPTWEVFALLTLLGLISIRDVFGVGFVIVESILLIQEPSVSETLLVLAPVLAGVNAFRPLRVVPNLRSEAAALRVVLFVVTVLLATKTLEPDWETFAVLVMLGTLSMRDVYGFGFVIATTILAFEAPDVSQPVLIVAAVLAGVSALRLTVASSRPIPFWWSAASEWWRPRSGFRLRPGASRRLRRWQEAGDS